MKISLKTELFAHVSFLDKLLFTKHIAIMLKSGITLLEALDIFAKQCNSKKFKDIVLQIEQKVQNGSTFSKALSFFPDVFSQLYINLVEVGEESGKLEENLSYLATQLSKEYEFRQKVQGALMYPTIVLVAAASVGLGISIFALPKLIEVFQGLPVQLPLSTRILMGFAQFMQHYGIVVLIALIIFIILFRKWNTSKKGKPVWDRFVLSFPLFGKVVQNAELTVICRNLGIMIQSGLPITKALEVEEKVTTNTMYKKYLQSLLLAVTKGKSLAKELDNNTYKFVPLIANRMIAVGEETGKVDETLIYLGDYFEDAVDTATKNITTLIEPILLLVIGMIVAFVALAIIMPIYSLTGSIGR